jgi:hypothetical protein
MTALQLCAQSERHRFSGSFDDFDKLIYRIPMRGRWTFHNSRRIFVFENGTTVTWFARPKSFLVDGGFTVNVLAVEAMLLQSMKRFDFTSAGIITTKRVVPSVPAMSKSSARPKSRPIESLANGSKAAE